VWISYSEDHKSVDICSREDGNSVDERIRKGEKWCGLSGEDPPVYVGLRPVYSGTFCLFIQAARELKTSNICMSTWRVGGGGGGKKTKKEKFYL